MISDTHEGITIQTDGKTALITGSGQNIGRGMAHHLVAAGLNIIINGSSNRDAAESVADEVRAHGVKALVVMGNVGNKTEAETIAKTGIAHFGAIDVLVNNAAIRPHAAFLETSDEDWQRFLMLTLTPLSGFHEWFCREWSATDGDALSVFPA